MSVAGPALTHSLSRLGRLASLNVFGCVADDGVQFLRTQLECTLINQSPLTDIARVNVRIFLNK